MPYEIKEISFSEIVPYWSKYLWPERTSVIEKISCINQFGSIDVSISQFQSCYYGCFEGTILVGVISCHPISKEIIRVRGIYVFDAHRKNGVGRKLIEQVKVFAIDQKYKKIFGLVREKNQSYFEKLGFLSYKRTNDYEYGPHVLMELKV